MKESHSEGVANHTDSESCGKTREGLAEALTGEDTGRAIEPRNLLREADAVATCGRQQPECRQREALRVPRGRSPWHVRTRYAREPRDPGFAREEAGIGPYREV